jgi:hypothetical protein
VECGPAAEGGRGVGAKSDSSPSVHFAVRWTPAEELAQKGCLAQDGHGRTLTLIP